MEMGDIWRSFWVVMATIVLASSRDEQCNQKLQLARGQTAHVDVIQLTSERQYCVIEFSTSPKWRVVLTFSYRPSSSNISIADDCAYAPNYLLIGNDFTAIGQEVMTSYKFCRETGKDGEGEEEIVSRDNHLWLVLRDSSHPHPHIPSPQLHLLTLKATALPQVSCSDAEMECSPVQCVPDSAVCDGHRDCANGLDEYCYSFTNTARKPTTADDLQTNHPHHHHHHHPHHPPSSPSDLEEEEEEDGEEEEESSTEQLRVPPADSACFMCRDGTCILPHLPRYDYRWGVWLWYLCDGVPHCPDGWDEQAYMCYLSRHFPQLAQSHLFQCEAYDAPATLSRQVRMWSLARCDERRDCRLQQEEGEDLCDNMLGVTRSDRGSDLHLNPLALTLVIAFAVVIVITAILILRYLERGRERTRDILTLTTSGGEREGTLAECSSEVQQSGCLAVTKNLLLMDKTAVPSLTHNNFERLRETTV